MRKNNRGFSLIELLAVITLLGILMGIAIAAYSRYKEKAINQSYVTLSESAADAAEEYFMDHMNATKIELSELVDLEYLENINDPASSEHKCSGTVEKENTIKGDGTSIDVMTFKVKIKCLKFDDCTMYPNKTKC